MSDLLGNEIFFKGLITGICLYQQKVVTAHKRKEPLKVGESLYYMETGKERLERVLHEICR